MLTGSLGGDERGSSPVEFVLVGTMLTALTLAVLQLALVVYVRNVVHDAAIGGAHHAALADVSPEEGAARARRVITQAVGAAYADDVEAARVRQNGRDVMVVRVRTALPVIGLIGIPSAMNIHAEAPAESFDER
ncbi:TadE family protein [Microbacterium sp. SZ1]|uniref:TadE/TadG family type IV pilus assembly protein n=1 Tax=Microbacterium sp. SZ1 TaxID=1849736 RepID=UPI000BBC0AC8|nr:TadE/TadG family type IV pilus assembly protein [Microbacterium sp. SZ1]PCE15894.1 TadE family protein [Microbacterium sp. SZ1]